MRRITFTLGSSTLGSAVSSYHLLSAPGSVTGSFMMICPQLTLWQIVVMPSRTVEVRLPMVLPDATWSATATRPNTVAVLTGWTCTNSVEPEPGPDLLQVRLQLHRPAQLPLPVPPPVYPLAGHMPVATLTVPTAASWPISSQIARPTRSSPVLPLAQPRVTQYQERNSAPSASVETTSKTEAS